MRVSLHLVPVTFADACGFVALWHRHHAPPIGYAPPSRLSRILARATTTRLLAVA